MYQSLDLLVSTSWRFIAPSSDTSRFFRVICLHDVVSVHRYLLHVKLFPSLPLGQTTVLTKTVTQGGRLKVQVTCRSRAGVTWPGSDSALESSRKSGSPTFLSQLVTSTFKRSTYFAWRLSFCREICYLVSFYPAIVAASNSDHVPNSTNQSGLQASFQFPMRPFVVATQALLGLPFILGKRVGAYRILRQTLLRVVYGFGCPQLGGVSALR